MEIIKIVLFDYDGVMTLDKSGTESTCNYISKNLNIDNNIFENEYRKYKSDLTYGKVTHEEIWKLLCENINMDIPISVLHDSFYNTPVDNEMHEFVLKIKHQNIKTGLITNNRVDRMEFINKKFDLNKYFDIIAISGVLGFGKESDKIFIETLEKMKIKPAESIFIDNQEKNLTIPKRLGIKTIHYNDKERNLSELKNKLKEYGIIM